MTILEWRNAIHRDRAALQTFRCTDEDLRMEVSAHGRTPSHSRMYEWEVQELVRGLKVPPRSKRWSVRVGLDADGIGAVLVSYETSAGEEYDLAFGAVAARLRHRFDGAIGDEMFQDTFDIIGQRCVELGKTGEVRITGLVHNQNRGSKFLCSRHEMTCDGINKQDDEMEDWSRMFPIPDVPLFE